MVHGSVRVDCGPTHTCHLLCGHASTAGFAHCTLVTDAGLAAMASACPQLESLYIPRLKRVTTQVWGCVAVGCTPAGVVLCRGRAVPSGQQMVGGLEVQPLHKSAICCVQFINLLVGQVGAAFGGRWAALPCLPCAKPLDTCCSCSFLSPLSGCSTPSCCLVLRACGVHREQGLAAVVSRCSRLRELNVQSCDLVPQAEQAALHARFPYVYHGDEI